MATSSDSSSTGISAGREVAPNDLVGSLTSGRNQPHIFLELAEVYTRLGLDIVSVDSHVRHGWFAKMLVARNTTGGAIPLTTIERGLRAVDRKYGLKTSCFIPPTTGEHDDEPNVDIVISAANEVGLLSRIVGKLAARGIDMMDIDIALDVEETRCTLFLSCNVPIEEESFFETLQAIRGDLDSLGLTDFVVHSPEALDCVTYIDYERPL